MLDAKYFYFDNPKNRKLDISILCGGYEQCAADFKIDRKRFPFSAIIFTVSGKGIFEINNSEHSLSYGSLLAFGPNRAYKLIADTKSPMEQFFLIFSENKANVFFKKSKILNKAAVKVSDPQTTLSIFKQILKIGLAHNEYAHEICCNYLKNILLEQSDEIHDKYFETTSYESFLQCKDHLENNFIKINFSTQLANECALDIRYIARLFRKYCKTRPHEYLMNLKMNKAINLLITTNFNINQISKMVGIEDPCHFSRIFKKKFKVAPTEYRTKF